LENGDIVTLLENDATGVTEEELLYGTQYVPGLRFLFIEPLLASERQWMVEHFVETMPESFLKYRLRKELRTCRRITLSKYPEIREQWEAFLEEQITELAGQWFSQLGLEVQILPRGVKNSRDSGSGGDNTKDEWGQTSP
jgi:hypothetical protein